MDQKLFYLLNDLKNSGYYHWSKLLKETVDAFETINMPEGLGDEFQNMKNTVKELNAKYEAMLGAMNK